MSTPEQPPPKSWVFVSHSNKDIEKVRVVRDELERSGHYPLLFFLKCINDHDELDDLITREIEARNFFLHFDSPHARASRWVQRELAFIRGLPNRVCHTVDLGADPLTQARAIHDLSRRATVFLSYARGDWPLVTPIYDALITAEYRVWRDVLLRSGESIAEHITAAITRAIEDGFVLIFLTARSLLSQWCRFETHSALEVAATHPRGAFAIIPIILADSATVFSQIPDDLRHIQFLDVSSSTAAEAGSRIIAHLRRE
jgi:TIR domain